MNSNENEYSLEDDTIIGEGNVERGYQNKFIKSISHGSMEVIGKRDMENSMSFKGVKIPSTPDGCVTSSVNTIKGEPAFEYMENPFQWS